MSKTFTKHVAITFDDVPGGDICLVKELVLFNKKILNGLKIFNAPSVAFVNGSKIYSHIGEIEERANILKLWVNNGHLLGNHTYSHFALSKVNNELAKEDVIRNERIINKEGLQYCYFRHPYLDTGVNKIQRVNFEKFLVKAGYIIAPVTIDTDDWLFNAKFTKIKDENNRQEIVNQYLKHTKRKFEFYEDASRRLFGFNIKHIWLLHDNYINSHVIIKLLELVKNMGYTFASINDALSDPVYEEDNLCYSNIGISWLYRWEYNRNKFTVDWLQHENLFKEAVAKISQIE